MELEGVEARVSPRTTTERKEETENETRIENDPSKGNGYFSSLVNAALSSLRLDVSVTDAQLVLLRSNDDDDSFVELTLKSLSYRDASKESSNGTVEMSGLCVRVDDRPPSGRVPTDVFRRFEFETTPPTVFRRVGLWRKESCDYYYHYDDDDERGRKPRIVGTVLRTETLRDNASARRRRL